MKIGKKNFGMAAFPFLLVTTTGCAGTAGNGRLVGGPLFGSSFACLATNTTGSALPVTLRLHREDGSINTSMALPIEPGKVRYVQDNIILEQMRYCTAEYVGAKGAVKGSFCVLDISDPGKPKCTSSVPLE